MRYCDKDTDQEKAGGEYGECAIMGKFENPLRAECKDRTQLVTINGICPPEQLENFLDGGRCRRWTEIVVAEELCIPTCKPDIEQMISISSAVELVYQQVINTPVKTTSSRLVPPVFNQEGTAITGKKLVVEGVLRQKMVYSAAQTQMVHAVHFDTPFAAFIVLDAQDLLTKKLKVDVCLEDIFVTDITPRKIYKNVTLIIRALPFKR